MLRLVVSALQCRTLAVIHEAEEPAGRGHWPDAIAKRSVPDRRNRDASPDRRTLPVAALVLDDLDHRGDCALPSSQRATSEVGRPLQLQRARADVQGLDPSRYTVRTMPELPPNTTFRARQRLEHGWTNQWGRVQRSHQRLPWLSIEWATVVTGEHLRDDVVHFFMDCYHLKDWLKHDQDVDLVGDVEAFINSSDALKVVADIANGQKHLTLTRPRSGDIATELVGEVVTHGDASGAEIAMTVATGGKTIDAGDLAKEALDEWRTFLASEGLYP